MDEVAQSGCRSARNDGDTVGRSWPRQFAVQAGHAFGFELRHDFAPAPALVAEGVCGVDVVDVERVAEVFVEMDSHFNEHGHARGKPLAGLHLEVGADESVAFAPDATVGACYGAVGLGVFLDERQVAVAIAVLVHFAQFGFQPIAAVERTVDDGTHKVVELKERQCVVHFGYFLSRNW